MGVTSELDLLIGESKSKTEVARNKIDKGLIEYSQAGANAEDGDAKKSKKKERQERYLTVQGLLGHPYFMSINEADIAVIIDEFERFTQSY